MPYSLNKSSLLAALEILNDKHFNKYKDLNFIESQKTTLDIRNGKKILDNLGVDLIQKYNRTKDKIESQFLLREILLKCLITIRLLYSVMLGMHQSTRSPFSYAKHVCKSNKSNNLKLFMS